MLFLLTMHTHTNSVVTYRKCKLDTSWVAVIISFCYISFSPVCLSKSISFPLPRTKPMVQAFTMKESVRSGIPVSLTQASITPWISAVIVEPETGTRQKGKRLWLSSLFFPTYFLLPSLLPSLPSSVLPSFFLLSFCPPIQFIYLTLSILPNIYQLHIKYEILRWSNGDKKINEIISLQEFSL